MADWSNSQANCCPSNAMKMDVDAGADSKEHPQGAEAIKRELETEEQEDDAMEWSDFARWTEEEGHVKTTKEEIDLKEEKSDEDDDKSDMSAGMLHFRSLGLVHTGEVFHWICIYLHPPKAKISMEFLESVHTYGEYPSYDILNYTIRNYLYILYMYYIKKYG